MEIKTKFAIGDKAWTVVHCKATEFEIGFIGLSIDGIVFGSDRFFTVPESECFASKDELIKYLSE